MGGFAREAGMHIKRFLFFTLSLFLLLLCTVGSADSWMFVSDLLLPSDTEAFAQTLEAITREAARHEAVIFLGDNTNNGREEEHTAFLAFLGEVSTFTDVYVVPGNHDLSGKTTPEVFAARYAPYLDKAFESDSDSLSRAYRIGDRLLLAMDTNIFVPEQKMTRGGGVTEAQIAWAEAVLANVRPGTEIIGAGHYPLLPYTEGRDSTERAPEFVELLTQHDVLAWMCGHRHSNYTLHAASFRQINVGQPTGYPAWVGILEGDGEAMRYFVQPLYPEDSETFQSLKAAAHALGEQMAAGSLKDGEFAEDEEAIGWFVEAYMAEIDSTLAEKQEALRVHPGHAKWQKAVVRAVTRNGSLGSWKAKLRMCGRFI